jgi:PAS domain S-box-containing protein
MHAVLESILAQAADATLIVDDVGTIRFANDRICHLLRYSPGELHGKAVELLIPARFRLAHIGHRVRFTDAHRTRPMGECPALTALCKDGSDLTVDISLNPIRRGLETLIVVVIHPRGSDMPMRRRDNGQK